MTNASHEQIEARTLVRLGALDLAQTFVDLAARLIRQAHDLEVFTNCREDEALEDMGDSVRLAERSIGRGKVALLDYLRRLNDDETLTGETFAYESDVFHRETGALRRSGEYDDYDSRIEEGIRRAFDREGL